ncbi:MAG: hypothetical protein HKN74_14870 [Acidimicrobiia bacterium]|nr:hypothetical protein [Acidimicrobiia bacterium]NNF11556.1 hypothetical protein [Acidimicrobiia bacterium]NNL68873.1 hypothetical protein [Acidimicrobiia bacterium]
MRRFTGLLMAVGLLASACADSPGDAATTSTAGIATTTTTRAALVTTSTTIVEVDSDCATAYSGVGVLTLDESDPSACIRVGTHFRIRFENGFEEPVEITWNGEPVSIEEVFEPAGTAGEQLGVGVHRIQSPRLPITIEVVDPATSRYTTEAMFLRSWGDLGPGVSLTDLEASGVPVVIPDEAGEGKFCTYGFIEGDPYSPGIMILSGTEVARLDATAPQHHTASDVRFGVTTQRVLGVYGDQIELEAEGERAYLAFIPRDGPDRSFALIFETGPDGTVIGFRTGLAGPVRWPDGCLD